MEKKCTVCGIVKPFSEYRRKNFVPKNGVPRPEGYVVSRCKECLAQVSRDIYDTHKTKIRRRQKEYYQENLDVILGKTRKRRKEASRFLSEYLVGKSCVDCGETDRVVLEFDHRVPEEKRMNVSQLVGKGRPIEMIRAEIEKCDIRCANCHRRKTAKQFGWYSNW